LGIVVCDNRREVEHALRRNPCAFVVQEMIRGEDCSVNALALKGEVLLWSSHHSTIRRESRKEMYGPTVKTRFQDSPRGFEIMRRLVDETDYSGLLNIDFIRAEDGRYCWIDGNPRIWGTHASCVALGANYIEAWIRLAYGSPPQPAWRPRSGTHFRASSFIRQLCQPGLASDVSLPHQVRHFATAATDPGSIVGAWLDKQRYSQRWLRRTGRNRSVSPRS
jgi:predicted ATP-grasp superfamily ATP-dependent carboligase